MPRPIRALIDLSALRRNLATLRAHARSARGWAVVKADAYGHGLERSARALAAADGFALLEVAEAERLRSFGIGKPILLLEGCFDADDLARAAALDLWTTVHSPEQIETIERAAPARSLVVFLKMNSGMNRLGFSPADYVAAHARLAASGKVARIVLTTHFADADGARGVAEQLARFEAASAALPGERSIANSAAALAFPETHRDWIRPGIMLYGCSPFAQRSADSLGLVPAMTLESRIIGVQHLAAGDRVGYGGSFVAAHTMRIGVVACGYADGYPRHAPSGTPILVHGQRSTTLGRVSMDMLVVNLSTIPEAGVGSEVELWGRGLSADEVATSAGTVSYELLCAVAPRVPRIEVADGQG